MSSLTACSGELETGAMEASKKREIHFRVFRSPAPPKVWTVIDGVKKHDGKPIKFTIQEISEDRYDDVADYMCTYFIADEPICNSINAKDNPLVVADFRTVWMSILKQGVSVAAFTDNPDGGKPLIAGANVLGVDFKDNDSGMDDFEYLSPQSKKIFTTIIGVSKEVDVYSEYDVDRYMFALGLCVNPSFRGQALGGHILRAREKIGREYKIPVTSTAFTSPASQKLAERTGFSVLLERDFDQILDEDGNVAFPNVKSKALKIMGRRLD